MEGGCYMGPILPGFLEDFLSGQRAAGINGSSICVSKDGSGGKTKHSRVGVAGLAARVQVRYDEHLPVLSL